MTPSEISIQRLQIEHLRETLGIGIDRPRLSWRVETSIQNWQQAGYEIECYGANGQLSDKTGQVASGQSVLVVWPFAPMQSRQQVSLRMRVWGSDGSESAWSEPVSIETGLLHAANWDADFISPDFNEDTSSPNPAPYLRRKFGLRPGIKSARLYITALGLYDAYINGQAVGDHVLSPGWTVYDQRLRYQTFDVTAMLQPGGNAIGVILGDGWFRGRIGFGSGKSNIWGEHLALLAQLEIQYADGSSERIVSDDVSAWRAATGAIVTSSIYDGETYDARLEPAGWAEAGFDDARWTTVHRLEWDFENVGVSAWAAGAAHRNGQARFHRPNPIWQNNFGFWAKSCWLVEYQSKRFRRADHHLAPCRSARKR